AATSRRYIPHRRVLPRHLATIARRFAPALAAPVPRGSNRCNLHEACLSANGVRDTEPIGTERGYQPEAPSASAPGDKTGDEERFSLAVNHWKSAAARR